MRKPVFSRAIIAALLVGPIALSHAQPLSVTTLAGTGVRGFLDGPANIARFADPSGVAVDGATNVYVADTYSNVIRRVTADATGTNWNVVTMAGSPGAAGYVNGSGAGARFNNPMGLAVDAVSNLYVADTLNNQIRRLHPDATGTNWMVTTLAGSPAALAGAADGTNGLALFNHPTGLALGSFGALWIADSGNDTIRRMVPDATGTNWIVTTFAGSLNQPGFLDASGQFARFSSPNSIAIDGTGNLYVADGGNNAVRRISPAGAVTTLAGGRAGPSDGSGTNAEFDFPCGIAIDTSTNIYVSDFYNFTIRRLSHGPSGWNVVTVAGQPQVAGARDGVATGAGFGFFNAALNPNGLAVDRAGRLYVADTENCRIRRASVFLGLLLTGAPQAEAAVAGSAVTLNALAVGAAPITYQWYFNDQPIAGATNSSLTLANLQTNQAGAYSVSASNSAGSTNSRPAFLNVVQPLAVTTAAGIGAVGDADGFGLAARFDMPGGVAADNRGNVIIADTLNDTIRRLSPDGRVATLAGSSQISGGVDGVGSAARFASPFGVAVDASDDVYVADTLNQSIRLVATNGLVKTIAGVLGVAGDADGAADSALFDHPRGVAVDASNAVYIADTENHQIRRLAYGYVTTLAGNGTAGFLNGEGANAVFNLPAALALDSAGNLFIADYGNSLIREMTPAGVVTTVAGLPGQPGATDGDASIAQFNLPSGIAVDSQENVYVADYGNHSIRQLIPEAAGQWSVSSLAGLSGVSGDADGQAIVARFHNPTGIAVDSLGAIYVGDSSNHLVRSVSPQGVVTSLAGPAGSFGSQDALFPDSRMNGPRGVAVDSSGDVFAADSANNTIRELTPDGALTTIAGLPGFAGSTDGLGGDARFSQPAGIAVDVKGNVYVADFQNSTIRELSADSGSGLWLSQTIAGSAGAAGYANGGGAAAKFNGPCALAVDGGGNIYVADYSNQVVRLIAPTGLVSTFAGNPGRAGYLDGSNAFFNFPSGLALDDSGNLFVADSQNQLIRRITPNGMVSTVAGAYFRSGSADGNGTAALFNNPQGLVFDQAGNLFVADTGNNAIREILPSGDVLTVAGTAGRRGSADGIGPVAQFNGPAGLAISSGGTLFIADELNNTLRGAVIYSGQPLALTPPYDRIVPVGAEVDFTPAAAGAAPLSFQWLKNGGPLPGATNLELTIPAAQYSDAAYYQLSVNNSNGAASSVAAALTVSGPVQIFSQPASLTVAPGAAAAFSVTAFGQPPLSYQWSLNGNALPGGTNSALTISSVQTADAGTYQVMVSNPFGSVSSLLATLAIGEAPHFVLSPSSQTAECGASATLNSLADGSPPLTYQWYAESGPIARATQPSYQAQNLAAGELEALFVVVNNAFGAATSAVAAVNVVDTTPPVLTLLGAATTNILVGSSYTDPGAVALDACDGLVPVTTNGSVNTEVVGVYSIIYRAKDAFGNGSTAARTVNVVPDSPMIISGPLSHTNYPGATQTFAVSAMGAAPLAYQWFKDSVKLADGGRMTGATNSALVIMPALPSDAGSYSVLITNVAGEVASSNAILVIGTAGIPLAVTGFNRDVVVENTASDDNTADYAQTFDATSPSTPFCLYEAGLNATGIYGNSPTNLGLAVGGACVSATDGMTLFQLAPYTASNVLYLTPSAPSGVLTLASPENLASLSILAASADGGGSGTCVLQFDNGSSSPPLTYNAADWQAAGTPGAVTHFGQLFCGFYSHFYSYNFTNNFPNLYQTTINLSDLGLDARPVTAITFNKALPGSATVTGVFALSATAGACTLRLKIGPPSLDGGALSFTMQTASGQSYTLQQTTNLSGPWGTYTNFTGTGAVRQFLIPLTSARQFFRLAQP